MSSGRQRPRRTSVASMSATPLRVAEPRGDLTMPVVYEDVLAMLAERHPELVVVTAENRAAIRGLPPKLGPRFIDVGICEQTMAGAAPGLALCGVSAVCPALPTFLTLRAYEFVRPEVGIGPLPVKLVGGVPGF